MLPVDMCNKYAFKFPGKAFAPFYELAIPATWADGAIPNASPEEYSIRDACPVISRAGAGVEAAMVTWAWAGPGGKPVFNFRSEGRSFANSSRCLVPADGFLEFTARTDGKKGLKDKHLFSLAGADWFWIAGLIRDGCFAMLTTAPGPDIAPFHDRQVVVLPQDRGLDWLDLSRPESELLRPSPAGVLSHSQVR